MSEPHHPSPLAVRRLRASQLGIIAVVALSLPAGAVAVFGFDANRGTTADLIGTIFFIAFVTLLTTPWWPTRTTDSRSTLERIQSTCFLWFGLSYTTHLTWELFWLLLHDRIVTSPDAAWAYVWWMYIDGGDLRYAGSDPTLITQEWLSVGNGLIGATALYLWWRSSHRSPIAPLLFMATAVVHLYSTVIYFGSEILDDFPNVDTTSFIDLWIKFLLLNGIWLVMPWFVLWWGWQILSRQGLRAPSVSVESPG